MTCSLAVIIQLLGHLPAPGSTIDVPAHVVARYSPIEQRHARACARRFGLKWRLVGDVQR